MKTKDFFRMEYAQILDIYCIFGIIGSVAFYF